MQHLARCLHCMPWNRTIVPGLWSSCRTSSRSHLSALNAAACFKGPPRVFYRTKRLVAHPPLQLARDPGVDELIQTSDSESDKRDRDVIFAALRTHLLQPAKSTRAIVDLLKQHFLTRSASTALDLNPSERAVLVEVLRRVLDDWARWEAASPSTYVSPVNMLAFFARYGVLEPQDWAFCLNSLALTALEAFPSTDRKDFDHRPQSQYDASLLVRPLLRAWKLFFYYHSSERHEVYEALYTDHLGVWPLLQHGALPNAIQDSSSTFNTRLLSFAPEWASDGKSFADQQLICASMISIAAVSQNIENSAPTSLLLPSEVIDWKLSTIGPPGLGRSKNETPGPVIPQQTAPKSEDAPFVLSCDELSLLFIVAHALNTPNMNLTLLRVSLAKIVPENQIGRIMSIFSEFKARVPDLLDHAVYEQGNSGRNLIADRLEHGVPAALVTKAVRRETHVLFKLIRYGLQLWPRGAPWADVHLVMKRFNTGLGSRYFRHNILRKISLVADAYGGPFKITVSPIPGSDTLSFETEPGFADVLIEQIPMRADIPASPIVEALGADFVSLISAIAEEYPDPKKTRLMLIAWTYCRLQGLPILREVGDLLRTQLSQLPFQQQLRLLGGDIYQRSCSAGYSNFAFVRTHFGPEFVVRRLEGLGLGRYAPLIRKLPWLGFTSYDDQLLLENGMTNARARMLFLDAMNDLYHDLKTIRKEAETVSPKRMVTKEGIWYLSDAIVDDSGSLRKIPFTSREPTSKREATKRFKLAAIVPKLLGGEMAVRRMKQRMLSKGRRSLTRGGKGLVARPLRAQLLRHRSRRHSPPLYQRQGGLSSSSRLNKNWT